MYIGYKTKESSGVKHIYNLVFRVTKEDINPERDVIKEIVLKIKAPFFLNWLSDGEIESREEEIKVKDVTQKYRVFEIRKIISLYPQDLPFDIISPDSDIGKVLYSVNDDNYHQYLAGPPLLWNLYGDGLLAQEGEEELKNLEKF